MDRGVVFFTPRSNHDLPPPRRCLSACDVQRSWWSSLWLLVVWGTGRTAAIAPEPRCCLLVRPPPSRESRRVSTISEVLVLLATGQGEPEYGVQ